MPVRSKYERCTCAACPENGQFFLTHALAAHRAKVAMLSAQNEVQDTSFHLAHQGWSDSSPEDLVLESVERLVTSSGTSRGGSVDELAGAFENLVIRTPEEDVTRAFANVSLQTPQNRSERWNNICQEKGHLTTKALGSLQSIGASLQLMEKDVQALENSALASSSAASQALLSMEESLLDLRLQANTVKREVPLVQDARKSIHLQLDSLEARILEMKALLPPARALQREFDCGSYFSWPVNCADEVAQVVMFIGVVCSVILMLSRRATSLVIGLVRIVLRSSLALPSGTIDTGQKVILDQIPQDPRTILSKYNLSGKTVIYATCPECHFTFKPHYERGSIVPSYPSECTNKRRPDSPVCGTPLLQSQFVNGVTVSRPVKPFVYHSVLDFIGALSSQQALEEKIDKACDDAMEALGTPLSPQRGDKVDDVFQGEFIKSFKGPDLERIFIDRKGEGRFAFGLNVDFFNINGVRAAGATTSCGIISMACLNLPCEIRYKSENLYVAGIIPGPHEPDLEAINNFVRPLMEDMVELWDPGVRLSQTALCKCGRVVRGAIVCAICDLPAARKLAALAGHRSDNFLCSVCKKLRMNIGDSGDRPARRCPSEMRVRAEAWKEAATSAEQDKIFKSSGVRYSELWRLPYWDPTRQLVVDPMHNLLEGIVEDHFRTVLSLTKQGASTIPDVPPAFFFDFHLVPPKGTHTLHPVHMKGSREYMTENEIKDVSKIHKHLVLPVECIGGDEETARTALAERLGKSYRQKSLAFVCSSLCISAERPGNVLGEFRPHKIHWAKSLANWRFSKPLASATSQKVTLVTSELLQHIRNVVRETSTPSWLGSVPYDFGDPRAGKLKADEWRTFCTIYLPLALISRWGEGTTHANARLASRCRRVLDHTMELVSAVTLACKYTTSGAQARRYEDHIQKYIRELRDIYPDAKYTTNLHMATHIQEFMMLFGPTNSWWCFPFERLIGLLQKMPSNNKFGQLESTIHESFIALCRIKSWSSRPDCPPAIKECRRVYDKLYPDDIERVIGDVDFQMRELDDDLCTARDTVKKKVVPPDLHVTLPLRTTVFFTCYLHNGVRYAISTYHVGNSLVLFRPGGVSSTEAVPGIVKYICRNEHDDIIFALQQYMPADPKTPDPFSYYPDFPARLFSSDLLPDLRIVLPRWVVSHFARYRMSSSSVAVLSLSRH